MHKFWEKVEHYNSKLILPAIVILMFVIMVELGFQDFAHHYHTIIQILDIFVIAVFVVDLIFLAIRAKSTKFFFKNYWLDMVAIFPFAIFLNVVSKLYIAFASVGKVAVGQAILHESLEARKGVRALARAGRFTRWIRVVARSLRIVTKTKLGSMFTKQHKRSTRNMKHKRNERKEEKLKLKVAKTRAKTRKKKSR